MVGQVGAGGAHDYTQRKLSFTQHIVVGCDRQSAEMIFTTVFYWPSGEEIKYLVEVCVRRNQENETANLRVVFPR